MISDTLIMKDVYLDMIAIITKHLNRLILTIQTNEGTEIALNDMFNILMVRPFSLLQLEKKEQIARLIGGAVECTETEELIGATINAATVELFNWLTITLGAKEAEEVAFSFARVVTSLSKSPYLPRDIAERIKQSNIGDLYLTTLYLMSITIRDLVTNIETADTQQDVDRNMAFVKVGG